MVFGDESGRKGRKGIPHNCHTEPRPGSRCVFRKPLLLVASLSVLSLLTLLLPCLQGSGAESPVAPSVTLAWDPSPDATVIGYYFYVFFPGAEAVALPRQIDVGNTTEFTMTNLQSGVTYWFYVTAYNSYRIESDPSDVIDYTPDGETAPDSTPPAVLSAPSGLQARLAGGREIELIWSDNSTNEEGFRIEQSQDGINFQSVGTTGPNVTTFRVAVSAGFPVSSYPYQFRVAAFQGRSLSLYSGPAIALQDRPDLEVIAASVSPSWPVEGSPVFFQATIRNGGRVATPQGINARVSFQMDGGAVVAWIDNTNSIPPNGTLTFSANPLPGMGEIAFSQAGWHTLTAVVDDLNQVAEENEANNQFMVPIPVTLGVAPQVAIFIDGTNVLERDPVGRQITFTRAGSTAASLAVSVVIGGTAKSGHDYRPIPERVVIPAGASSTNVSVVPMDDPRINPPKTLTVALAPDVYYQPGTNQAVSLVIEDSDVDSDGDGASDRVELLAGTSAADHDSNLRIISVQPTASGELLIKWSSVPGTTYRVLASTSPTSGDWTEASPPIPATERVTQWQDSVTNSQRYYAISVEASPALATRSIVPTASGGMVLAWFSTPGLAYRLLAKTTLEGAEWNVVSPPIKATEAVTLWTNYPTGNSTFYQLAVDPEATPTILSIRTSPSGDVLVLWASVPGTTYQVQALSPSRQAFDTISSPAILATGSVTSWFHQASQADAVSYSVSAIAVPTPGVRSFTTLSRGKSK